MNITEEELRKAFENSRMHQMYAVKRMPKDKQLLAFHMFVAGFNSSLDTTIQGMNI
jgi:hypothetical protein